MYLRISNKGEVDPLAFTLVGASTKRNDENKIGMFGSGNKYAIAHLFRNNYDFHVFSGDKQITFELKPVTLHDETFNVVVVDGKETSITTNMGTHWTLWQAIRELYSNAVDEGLIDFDVVEHISFEESNAGCTVVFIELKPDLQDIWENIGDYFAINKELVFECSIGRIYKKHSPSTCVYRKGIRCFDTTKPSIFDYDFNDIAISETRIIRFSWDLPQEIWKLLYKCDNEYVVRKVLNSIETTGLLERGIDDSMVSTYSDDMSDTWKRCLKESNIVPSGMGGYVKDSEKSSTKILPKRLYTDLVSKFGEELKPKSFRATRNGVSYRVASPTPLMLQIIKDVQAFFKECKFEIEYPVDVVDFMNKNIHGGIADETILIDINAFDKGAVWIANIMIEEFIHIKYGAPDESRQFQDESIRLFLRYMQEHNAYKL